MRVARPFLHSPGARRRALATVGGGLVLVAVTAALLPFRDHLASGTCALALLAPVLVAAFGGLRTSLVAAVAGALVFNVLFTRPYGSFRIESSEDVSAFVAYAVVAVAFGLVVNRVRATRDVAEQRALSVALLQELTAGTIREPRLEPALRDGLRRVVETLGLAGAAMRIDLPGEPVLATAGAVDAAERALTAVRSGVDAPGCTTIPIVPPDGPAGAIVVAGPLDLPSRRFVESFAGVLALAAARATLERELVRRRSLEETDRLRTALVQSVSHDLRTPLTAIRALAGALRDTADDATRRSLADDVAAEAARLARLVESMLDLSRIEAGALRVRRARVPIDDVVWAAIDAAVSLPESAVHVEIADDLPAPVIDETMIRQVFVNLLENAAQHGDGERGVDVLVDRTGDKLRIAVADHGPGVPAAERERVFEPYARLGRDGGGSGLGLAIARGFVTAHGGALTLAETPGGGATFVVTLRLPEAAGVRRVLVVEDEPKVLRALAVALEAHDYEVVPAGTGEQAVARAADRRPDLILLDLGLPGLGGLEVIRRVRAFLAATPIIVVSAQGDEETKVTALDLGADDYVEKPFALPELLARVRVGLRHAERAAGAVAESAVLERGPLRIDLAEHRVTLRGEPLALTPTQFDLLACFARHPGRLLTHRAIVAEVWGDADAADAQNLRVFVSQLRRRVEEDPRHPRLIVTDTGVGYRFLPDG